MEFDMRGQDWTWGNHALDQVRGLSLSDSILSGVPIDISTTFKTTLTCLIFPAV